jgi:hypothetical protein
MSIYTDNGYKDREDYLICIAYDYGIEHSVVDQLAAMLGPSEDFDGLVIALQDAEADRV